MTSSAEGVSVEPQASRKHEDVQVSISRGEVVAAAGNVTWAVKDPRGNCHRSLAA